MKNFKKKLKFQKKIGEPEKRAILRRIVWNHQKRMNLIPFENVLQDGGIFFNSCTGDGMFHKFRGVTECFNFFVIVKVGEDTNDHFFIFYLY